MCEELFVILLYHISFVFSNNFCVQFSKMITVQLLSINSFPVAIVDDAKITNELPMLEDTLQERLQTGSVTVAKADDSAPIRLLERGK